MAQEYMSTSFAQGEPRNLAGAAHLDRGLSTLPRASMVGWGLALCGAWCQSRNRCPGSDSVVLRARLSLNLSPAGLLVLGSWQCLQQCECMPYLDKRKVGGEALT